MNLTGTYRFEPHQRLHCSKEYQQVFRHGHKVVGKSFVCYLRDNEASGFSRLGLTVSRKVGGAVVRNRVKRHLREFFRLHQGEFAAPIELVVVARKAAATLDSASTHRAMRALLERKGLLHG